MKTSPVGPQLAKTQTPPLFSRRTLHLASGNDARWKALFESADIVSEGAPVGFDPDRRYFGSTDIVLDIRPERPGDNLPMIAGVLASDPHVHVRATRLARREAAQRANGPLSTLTVEVSILPRERGLAVHVEVEAHVEPDRRAVRRVP